MYPRWLPGDQYPPPPILRDGGQSARASCIESAPEPIPDLESQLSAELDGASWAVAAFAPEDARWAHWIYRNLNGYPVAPSLIERPTAHRLPRPDCLSVFPDLRDPGYAAHYPRALEVSGYLIVVCSPGSARCAAVDEQIRAFKSAGGEERIIALVVEGYPDGTLESAARTDASAWLPAWLRWRLEGDAFSEADRCEPRVVDARPGRASLKEARDLLLATLLDVDAWELEIMGCLSRPVETVAASQKPAPVAPRPAAVAPAPTMVVPRPAIAPRPRNVGPILLTAAVCVSVTLATAWWSFGRTSDHPPVAPSEPLPIAFASAPAPPETEAPPDSVEPPPADPTPTPPPAPVAAVPASIPVAEIPAPPAPSAAAAEETAIRAAVLDLHRRGDAAVAHRHLEDALGFYEEAVSTVRDATPRASAEARADAALLCRKLGTLQIQLASTAEARASFVQGRKLLVQLKKSGHWNSERAKVLAEIETSLGRLPRD